MKAQFNAADEQEAEQIREGLKDPATRALVKIMGVLKRVNPSERAHVLRDAQRRLVFKS